MTTTSNRPESERLEAAAAPRAARRLLINGLDVSILLSGAVAFVLLMVVGIQVYRSTRRLDESKDLVEHTQKILTTLERTERLADHVEMGTRLYGLERQAADLRLARDAGFAMQTVPLRLDPLMTDDTARKLNLDLSARTEELNRDLQDVGERGEFPPPSLARCRATLAQIRTREEVLVKLRADKSHQRYITSLRTEWLFVALALVTVATTFIFLTYEMLGRRRAARKIVDGNAQLQASVRELEETAYQSSVLLGCSDELQLCVSGEQIFQAAIKYLERLLPETSGAVCMINASRNLMGEVARWGESGMLTGGALPPDSCCGLRLGQLRWRRPGISEIECTHFLGAAPSSYVCVPMMAHGQTLGILTVDCTSDEGYEQITLRMQKMLELLQLVAMATASLNLRRKLENQAIRDGLTGVYNRHFMEITLERELSRATRLEGTLAVFMLDVDHFKRFNDRYGHPAGDAMLRAVAQVLRFNIRTEDTVCRYGGEEFAVILPGVTPEAARERAELIRMAVSRLRISLEGGAIGEVTVSIGVSQCTPDLATGDALVAAADRALYAAKKAGRNRVEVDRNGTCPEPLTAGSGLAFSVNPANDSISLIPTH